MLVADSRELIQWGLRALFAPQAWVAACLGGRSGDEALELAREHQPDVALVDTVFSDTPGVELAVRLREVAPAISVVLMSDPDRISAPGARAAGISGYISKSWRAEEITDVVRVIARGARVFAPEPAAPGGSLSDREMQVLRLLATGATVREIAARLYLSPHTVKDHTTTLYRKVNARNRAEAMVLAQRLGLLL